MSCSRIRKCHRRRSTERFRSKGRPSSVTRDTDRVLIMCANLRNDGTKVVSTVRAVMKKHAGMDNSCNSLAASRLLRNPSSKVTTSARFGKARPRSQRSAISFTEIGAQCFRR